MKEKTRQSGRAMDKKLISASFQMFGGEKSKSKSLSNSRDFYPGPSNNEKLSLSIRAGWLGSAGGQNPTKNNILFKKKYKDNQNGLIHPEK